MAHASLYRKYRPQTFADVVGQTHVTRTLRNAVAEGTVAHAYLFTGPRGTGKTTVARILAKALECEAGPTAEPDGTCQSCIDIAEGRHPDVFELDAASRTQVEIVREEIIGRLAYAPTRGRWKVYIIDEVHMLSTSSFNALLKSIEEPPSHVVFILCTTHAHKVPETIHSRCQRFDFRRISVEDISERLRFIADAEHITVADSALALIARHAAGGMRDAITTIEQLAAFTGDQIAFEDVEGLLGEVDRALLFEAADLVAQRDIPGSFRFVARLTASGADLSEFVRGFVGHARDLYVAHSVGDATGIVDSTPEELARLTSQAALFGSDRLARVLDVLGELSSELRWSSDPRLSLEVAFTRLARPQGELTLEALAERIETLEVGAPIAAAAPLATATPDAAPRPAPAAVSASAAASEHVPASPAAPPSVGATSPARATSPSIPAITRGASKAPEAVHIVEPTGAGGPLDRARVKRAWQAVLAEVRKQRPTRVTAFVNTEVDVDPDGMTLVVEFPREEAFTMKIADEPETRQLLKRSLALVLGSAPPFRYQLGRGAVQRIPEPERPQHTDVPPATAPDETTTAPGDTGAFPRVSSPPAQSADAERLLVHGLGAEIIGEHVHDAVDRKDEG
jgi:DNA polymerase-3 subunit gamma/tau